MIFSKVESLDTFYKLTNALKEDGAYNLARELERLVLGKTDSIIISNKNLAKAVKINLSGKSIWQRAQELLKLMRFSKEVRVAISKGSFVISS